MKPKRKFFSLPVSSVSNYIYLASRDSHQGEDEDEDERLMEDSDYDDNVSIR